MSRPLPIPLSGKRPSPPARSNTPSSSGGSRGSSGNSILSDVPDGVFRMDSLAHPNNAATNAASNDQSSAQTQRLYEVPVTHSQRFLDYQRTQDRNIRSPLSYPSRIPPRRNSSGSLPPPYSTYPINTPVQGSVPRSYDATHPPVYPPSYGRPMQNTPSTSASPAHGGAVQPPPSYAPAGNLSVAHPTSHSPQDGQATSPTRRGRSGAVYVGLSESAPPSRRRSRR